jgi:Lon-like protease
MMTRIRKLPAISMPALPIRLGKVVVTFDISWLIVAPLAIWMLATAFVPVLATFLTPLERWGMALLVVLLSGLSLLVHVLAHVGAARISGSKHPPSIPIYPLGDAAQVWPASPTSGRDAFVALAGPAASFVLAGVAYLLWDAQFHPYLNGLLPLLIAFNVGWGTLNFVPAAPLDGGRLVRAIGWGLLGQPARATRFSVQMGYALVIILTLWAIFLMAQRARFSLENGGVTLGLAVLILLALASERAWQWQHSPVDGASTPAARPGALRTTVAAILLLGLLLFFIALLPLNDGLQIPGVSPSAVPMVEVPPEYRYPFTGDFILTTVILQTPITVGQWVFGHLSPITTIVPPERVVPPDTTIQEVAEQGYSMLEESERTAIAMGLQLAGYPVEIVGHGVRVLSVQEDSLAAGLLQPGDVLVGLDGAVIATTSDLNNLLHQHAPGDIVQLAVERAGQTLEIAVPLMAPFAEDRPPRIGISIESAGVDIQLPFPVQIIPQKIVGGPSAGLMFTLTVYNWVTPEDVTGGHIIAGTGAIDMNGIVGPIGGVQQKVVGAELAGAEYFLAPPENYADALSAARTIQVVEIATAEQAIEFLRALPQQAQAR